ACAVILAATLLVLLALGVPLYVVIGVAAALAFCLYAGDAGIAGLPGLVGTTRGGLAIAALLASVIFAARSGSSPVTLIAIGGILFPAMLRAGYREPFALGLVTTAGSLGCLI